MGSCLFPLAPDQLWPGAVAIVILGLIFHKAPRKPFLSFCVGRTDRQKHRGSLSWSLWSSPVRRQVRESDGAQTRLNSLVFAECSVFGTKKNKKKNHSKHGTLGQAEEIRFRILRHVRASQILGENEKRGARVWVPAPCRASCAAFSRGGLVSSLHQCVT